MNHFLLRYLILIIIGSSINLCDFEIRDLCTWMNVDDTDEFDWLLNIGPTETPNTGPSIDHTFGTSSGTYIFIRGSNPAKEGWRAQLYSEPIADSRPACISFWFHAYGSVCFVV